MIASCAVSACLQRPRESIVLMSRARSQGFSRGFFSRENCEWGKEFGILFESLSGC